MRLCTCSLVLLGLLILNEVKGENTTAPLHNETMHIFLLLVRDSDLNRINQRFRQDEEDGEGAAASALSFAQTGQNLAQIIQGVFTGNLSPIFSGSVKFISDSSAQRNLGNFLGAIAPALNLVLREGYTRTQTAFGFGVTTPNATVAAVASASPSPFIESSPSLANGNVTYFSNPVNTQQVQQQLPQPVPTTAWQYVLNQIYYTSSTVEPLPLIRRRTPAPVNIDEDDYKGI